MADNLTEMPIEEIKQLYASLKQEMIRRRVAYINETAKAATITQEQADKYAERGRALFSLPIADWALVRLAIGRKRAELPAGITQFWPIITPNPETPEYLELFKNTDI